VAAKKRAIPPQSGPAPRHIDIAVAGEGSPADTTDDEPVLGTARSGRTNAIISPSCWYKKSVRLRLTSLADRKKWFFPFARYHIGLIFINLAKTE
jgi:hypothetical protein